MKKRLFFFFVMVHICTLWGIPGTIYRKTMVFSLPHTPEAQHGSRNVLILTISPKSCLHSLKPTF